MKNLSDRFRQAHGITPRIFSAPGRVNLIGEHTDYNDGFVLPMAINRRTYVAAAPNDSRTVELLALDLDEKSSFELDEPNAPLEKTWLRYIAGVAFDLGTRVTLAGADLMISSNVPIGAGLASSAALEVSAGAALLAISKQKLDPFSLALTAQQAEHTYAGTRCGIMDQLTACVAESGQALLIDCRTLEVTNIPLNLAEIKVVVCNTNVKHELASSAYNQRRQECHEAVRIMRKYLPEVRALRDVSSNQFSQLESELPEPLNRRARHVITENERTVAAFRALQQNDLKAFGRLMYESHVSLRDDYEVSSPELDTLVKLAEECEGVIGARMTGGGFGGCTVNLVHTRDVNSFETYITKHYYDRTGIEADIYVVGADDHVKEETNG